MSSVVSAWRRRWALWAPPLVLSLAATAALVIYRLEYAGESAGLERRLEEREGQLTKVREEKARQEALLERAASNQRAIDALYRERFSTRQSRLLLLVDEVKDMARRAGMQPQTISYPEEAIEEFGLVERSFVFSVDGTYQEMRAFLNFLDLSPSFLTIREISVQAASGAPGLLRLNLKLSTLFAAPSPAETAVAAGTGAAS